MHQRGDTQQGQALIRLALEAGANIPSRYNDLGNILCEVGDLQNAAEAFRASLMRADDDANVWNNLASVLHRQLDFQNAEDAYRKGIECNRDFVPALKNLAALLAETGREDEASLYWCRAFILPPLPGKPSQMLGVAYYRLGRIAEAAECYREWLRTEPGNAIAQHYLAACTGQDVPSRAPDTFVKAVFDDQAENFDEKLVRKLSYRGPEIITKLLEGMVEAEGKLDVLDGGCGTGLCGPALAPYAARLFGVDLSAAMLAKAGTYNLYGELAEAELTAYLLQRKRAFDLVAMADTLIYFGDMADLFAAVAESLRPGGLFAFTAERVADATPEVDFHLGPSGRYLHSRQYLAELLAAKGFALLRDEDVVLRNEFCRPVVGVGMLARLRHQR